MDIEISIGKSKMEEICSIWGFDDFRIEIGLGCGVGKLKLGVWLFGRKII